MADKIIAADPVSQRSILDDIATKSADAWEKLRTLDEKTLVELGCKVFCGAPDEDWNIILQIPASWYDYAPESFVLDGVDDKPVVFRKDATERKDGVLSYGIKIQSEVSREEPVTVTKR